jgi:hypothetical protein
VEINIYFVFAKNFSVFAENVSVYAGKCYARPVKFTKHFELNELAGKNAAYYI